MGKKGTSKRGITWEKKMNLSICIFSVILLFRFAVLFAFILHLFCFFPGRKQNKCKIKAKKQQIMIAK
jgi:hypothetical protein